GRVIMPHVPVPKERWRPINFGQFSPSVAAKPFHLEQSVLSCRVPSTVISSRLSAGKDVRNTEGVTNDRNLFAVQFELLFREGRCSWVVTRTEDPPQRQY